MIMLARTLKDDHIATPNSVKPTTPESVDKKLLALGQRRLHAGTLNTEQLNTEGREYQRNQRFGQSSYKTSRRPPLDYSATHESVGSLQPHRLPVLLSAK